MYIRSCKTHSIHEVAHTKNTFLILFSFRILVEGNGSGYEVAGSSSRRPEEPPGKKPKKKKKGQEPDKPVGVVYAQVDKSKQKSKASQNTYDQSERPKSKVRYITGACSHGTPLLNKETFEMKLSLFKGGTT